MHEHLRRITAVGVAGLVGLALVIVSAPPASALACPPMSSLCNPTGLAVLIAGQDGITAGTATAVAGTAAASATLAGVSFGASTYASAFAVATGGAAVVGIGGWSAGAFHLGVSVPAPMLGDTPPTGWAGGVNVAPGVPATTAWQAWSAAFLVLNDPAYLADNVNVSVRVHFIPGVIPPSGTAPVWTSFHVIWRNPSGVETASTTQYAFQTSDVSDHTVTLGGAVGYKLLRVEVSAANSWTGAAATWFPVGSPSRPPAPVPGRGTLTQTIECKGTDGVKARNSSSQVIVASPSGSFPLPWMPCPSGKVMTGYGTTWQPDSGALIDVVPWTGTAGWVQDIPTAHPDCLTGDCHLDLRKRQPGGAPATSCGYNAQACGDWYADPSKADDYQCFWGANPVTLETCSTFRRPGQTLPNVKTQTDAGGVTRPTVDVVDTFPSLAADPPPASAPAPGSAPESSDCFPSGWSSITNPVEWVLKPVGCALTWAFVPTTLPQTVDSVVTKVQTRAPVVELGSVFTWFGNGPTGASHCVVFTLPFHTFAEFLPDVKVFDTCDLSSPVIAWLVGHRTLLGVFIWVDVLAPLGWWAWKQYAPGASGVA